MSADINLVKTIRNRDDLASTWDELIAPNSLKDRRIDLADFEIMDEEGRRQGPVTEHEMTALQEHGISRYHAWNGWCPSRESLLRQLEKEREINLCITVGKVESA